MSQWLVVYTSIKYYAQLKLNDKMEKKFIRVRTLKDIIIFTSVLIIGLLFVAITETELDNMGGYTLIAIGIILACFLKTGYEDIDTHEKYFKRNFTFSGDMKTPLLSALSSSPELIDMSQEGNGQVLRLSVYCGKTTGKAYLQLFVYVPHLYVPCSEMYEHEMSKVEKILK